MRAKKIVIIGAGPAGLGCAEAFKKTRRTQERFDIFILEKNDRVGGLARTYKYQGLFFDIGPHRFYTKNRTILRLWRRVLGKRFMRVKRCTRILYNRLMFAYPLRIGDMVTKLGLRELGRCLVSYLSARFSYRNYTPKTFEEWITRHFGKRLFEIFFKMYTEKIWGIRCDQISAKWESQRIRSLHALELIRTLIFRKQPKAKSLVGEFYYPTKGSGYMFESWARQLRSRGIEIGLNSLSLNLS